MIKIAFLTLIVILTCSCKKESSTPKDDSTFTDTRDGQIYKKVKIGNQIWMAENLNYYTPTGSNYYNNDSAAYSKPYGRLYSWEIAMNGESPVNTVPSNVKGICPKGWHLPSTAEYKILADFLEEHNLTGNDLKETGTTYWSTDDGTDSTSFSAVGTGTMSYDGTSSINLKELTVFITSSYDSGLDAMPGWVIFSYLPVLIEQKYLTNSLFCV